MTEANRAVTAEQISVTAADIDAGLKRDPRKCAVALAVRRQLGVQATVTGASVELANGCVYRASWALADWLWDFDEDRHVEPVVVELRSHDLTAGLLGELRRQLLHLAPWRNQSR